MDDKILRKINNTILYERIKKIRTVYERLEKKQIAFCNEFSIHCLKGCGKCCENFTPDITEAEAEFLAYGLIKEGKDDLVLELLKLKDNDTKMCPLFIKDSEFHCLVYKWRPLICRLFGASASKDKEGHPVFRKCKWNYEGKDLTKEEFEAHKKYVIIMSDYGEAINEIDPSIQEKKMLDEALTNAIYKIRFILELENNEN